MTKDTSDSIYQICETLGPSYSAKLLEATNKISVIASAELDLSGLDAKALAGLPVIRDHVLADRELDIDKALEQLASIEGVQKRLKGQAEAERLNRAHAARTANLSPHQRMSYARSMGLTGSEAKKAPQSELSEGEARKRLEGLSGAAAIAFARKHGLI